MLDGEEVEVNFNDGDTFKIYNGEQAGSRARIVGFNALESYGPVHRWGDSSFEYLYEISKEATLVARNGFWNCKKESGRDGYGRLLVVCDDLALDLIGMGLAHAYSVDKKPAKKSYLKAQKEAQKEEAGMWKYGVPKQILTSLHSASELGTVIYDRAISTADGATELIKHEEIYDTCEVVCIEEGFSCMVFVPFNQRYSTHRPECLRVKSVVTN